MGGTRKLRHVDPQKRRGRLYLAICGFSATKAGGWLSVNVAWKVDRQTAQAHERLATQHGRQRVVVPRSIHALGVGMSPLRVLARLLGSHPRVLGGVALPFSRVCLTGAFSALCVLLCQVGAPLHGLGHLFHGLGRPLDGSL